MLNRFAFGTLDERTVRRRVDSLPDQGEARRKSRRVVNLPDHGASARESRARARARSRQVQGPDTPYILEELSELDAKGLPDPISADQKKIIMDRAHDSYHQPVVACSVCNQFCSLSANELLLPCELPPAVFTVLQPSPGAEPLSAELLAQYDISRAFLAAPPRSPFPLPSKVSSTTRTRQTLRMIATAIFPRPAATAAAPAHPASVSATSACPRSRLATDQPKALPTATFGGGARRSATTCRTLRAS